MNSISISEIKFSPKSRSCLHTILWPLQETFPHRGKILNLILNDIEKGKKDLLSKK